MIASGVPGVRAPADELWWVYVLRSTLRTRSYVGITIDLPRRLQQHNGKLPGGARSTRVGRPWKIAKVYGPYLTRARASQVEYAVKSLRGARRLSWVEAADDVPTSDAPTSEAPTSDAPSEGS